MRVLLSHGYFLFEDSKELKIMKPYPPLGILYLSAYLTKNRVKNELYDTTFSKKDDFKAYLKASKPDVIGLYTNLMTKLNIIETINFIKSEPELKGMKIVLGGPDITHNVENYLKQGADFCIIGEGEQTILELCQALAVPDNPFMDHINGLAYLNYKGEVFKTAARQKIKNINELPLPNRDGIDMQKYIETWKTNHGKGTINVSTQRGCPYTCKWCSTAVYGQSYRRRSPEKVVDELVEIKTKYNPDAIWFVDDVFTVSHKWLNDFKDELAKRNAHIPFECITRADRLNEDVMETLRDCGCFRVWIGAESGSQKIIDAMDRRVDVGRVRDMIHCAQKNNIEAGTFIMLGYPGETKEDIEATIDHLKVSSPDQFTITLAYPIKGTGLYEETQHILTTQNVWAESTDRDIDFKRNFSRRFYDYAIRKVYNEVNFSKTKSKSSVLNPRAISYKARSLAAQFGMWWEGNKTN